MHSTLIVKSKFGDPNRFIILKEVPCSWYFGLRKDATGMAKAKDIVEFYGRENGNSQI